MMYLIYILIRHLDWNIHWDLKTISGSVSHTLQAHEDGVSEVILDTSFLSIKQVSIFDPKATHSEPLKVSSSSYKLPS
jgi:leukotriene-A4 hydrolase